MEGLSKIPVTINYYNYYPGSTVVGQGIGSNYGLHTKLNYNPEEQKDNLLNEISLLKQELAEQKDENLKLQRELKLEKARYIANQRAIALVKMIDELGQNKL